MYLPIKILLHHSKELPAFNLFDSPAWEKVMMAERKAAGAVKQVVLILSREHGSSLKWPSTCHAAPVRGLGIVDRAESHN